MNKIRIPILLGLTRSPSAYGIALVVFLILAVAAIVTAPGTLTLLALAAYGWGLVAWTYWRETRPRYKRTR